MKSIFIFGEKNNLSNYFNAFENLGIKTIISTQIELAENCDFLCLAGGGDLNPYFYGENNLFCNNLDTARDLAELELIWQFIRKNKPIIGICRGLQVLNVYFGGSLLQDLKAHKQINDKDVYHKIICLKNGVLFSRFGCKISVNSAHHQCIKTLGKNLIVDSISKDGIIESFYHKTLPIYACQFHPERLKNNKLLKHILSFLKIKTF